MFLGEKGEPSIGLSLGSYVPAQSDRSDFSGESSIVINLGKVDLNRSMVFGGDNAVGSSALARHERVDELSVVVLHGDYYKIHL